jgi:hypothetical protein
MGYGQHKSQEFARASGRSGCSTRALRHWNEQEAAALADFMPVRLQPAAADRFERFVAGWWIAPVLALSITLWGTAGWYLLG